MGSTPSTYRVPEVKIVVVGNTGVGKSALSVRLFQNHFVDEYDPTIEDSYRQQVLVDGDAYLFHVFDTANQEESMDCQLRNGDTFLLLYSITDSGSFEAITNYYERIRTVKQKDRLPMCLVGTKSDLAETQRQVPTPQGQDLSSAWGVPFCEVSAKSGANSMEPFFQAVREWREDFSPAAAPFKNWKEGQAIQRLSEQPAANCLALYTSAYTE